MIKKLKVFRCQDGDFVQVSETMISEDSAAVLKQLAFCFRELHKDTRKNEKITKAKFWETFSADGLKDQHFKFIIEYDENNKYIYEYYFSGCGLD